MLSLKHPLTSSLILLLLSQGALANNSNFFNGKTTAMGGVGIASSDFKNGAILNPALVAKYSEDDDFGLNINIGAIVSDKDELVDNADNVKNLLDRLDGLVPSFDDANQLIESLQKMNLAAARINGGGYLQAAIPNRHGSVTFFAGAEAHIGLTAIVTDADIAYLTNARDTLTPIDESVLTSSGIAIGALVTEYGISVARTFEIKGKKITFGASPKYQKVKTIEYIASVADFDDDNFDAKNYTLEDGNINLDLGAHSSLNDNLDVAVVLKNVIKNEYATIAGRSLEISPQVQIGGAYSNSWFRGEIDVDLNSVEDLVTQNDIQTVRLGVEFDTYDWAQLRLGYKHDIKDTLENTYSAGIGLSPFGVVNIDISAIYGENETYGAAIQLGLNF